MNLGFGLNLGGYKKAATASTITITGNPSISGTAEVGQTLTGSDGTATGTGTTSVTARQWYRDGVAISGETGTTYLLAAEDDGADITFGVTWSDDNGTKGATSAATSVTYAAPVAGSLSNQSFDVDNGVQTYDASAGFTGLDLTYAITASPDATNITINSATGVISFDTNALVDGDDGTVTVQATNSGGSDTASFTLTMNATDTTPPGVTNYNFTVATNTISADVTEPCDLYWSITSSEETTNSNIKDGTGAIDNGGPIAIESGGNSDAFSYSGTDGTAWLNLLWEDASGNQTRISTQYTFPDTTAPSVSSATDTQTGATTADWGCTSDEASGTIYAAVRLSASSTLTKSEIENGTGNAVATDTDASPTADANNGGSFTGLTASTAYTVDLFQRDAAGNESAVISGDGFTTAAGGGTTPVAADFDGVNDYIEQGQAFSNEADDTDVMIYAKVSATGSFGTVLQNSASHVALWVDNGFFTVQLKNTGGTVILDHDTTLNTPDANDGTMREVFISYDGVNGTLDFYVGSSADGNTSNTLTTGTVGVNQGNWAIGAQTNGSQKLTGSIERVAMWIGASNDLSVSGNRDEMSNPDSSVSGGTKIMDVYTESAVSTETTFDNQAGTGDFEQRNGAF